MALMKKTGTWNGQRIALVLFLVIGGFFLWTEHRAHLLGFLPYFILLLCPLMHLFMHRGHGGHGGAHHDHSDQSGKGDAS